eukprot:520920-Rhodomonas_salina.1
MSSWMLPRLFWQAHNSFPVLKGKIWCSRCGRCCLTEECNSESATMRGVLPTAMHTRRALFSEQMKERHSLQIIDADIDSCSEPPPRNPIACLRRLENIQTIASLEIAECDVRVGTPKPQTR